jgi:hypothetical protein
MQPMRQQQNALQAVQQLVPQGSTSVVDMMPAIMQLLSTPTPQKSHHKLFNQRTCVVSMMPAIMQLVST